MKRFLFVLAFVFLFIQPAWSQFRYASRIAPAAALPATCNPLNGDVVMLTAGAGISPAFYVCTATNKWTTASMVGTGGFVWAQGTLTASTPIITHTATWNNGAVTFRNIVSNITNTASGGGSTLLNLQVGGVDQMYVTFNGQTYSVAGFITGANASYEFSTRSRVRSTADGLITLQNSAANDFTRLNFGSVAVTHPAIAVSAAVGGQTQGIIITRADGTNQVFASLGAATNGSMIYCADCTVANPCAGGGTGAIAKRLNGAWVCN